MKLDILVLAAHPDDAELGCSGTLIKQAKLGYKTGVVDFTKGELGTRGTVKTREEESGNASKIMGLSARENLGFRDGYFKVDEEHLHEVIRVIRKYQPEVLIMNAPSDRHPDHGRAHQLSKEAGFLAGLKNIKTLEKGKEQEAWRPKTSYSYIQGRFIEPDFVVDIDDSWEKKMEAILAYKTQFYDPDSKEPKTWLSTPEFLKLLEGRAIEFGQAIGSKYGEGFLVQRWLGVDDIMNLK